MIRNILIALIAVVMPMSVVAQARSEKRGMGWDEKNISLGQHHISLMADGVSWFYNWGNTPANPALLSAQSITFVPMCWNSNYNATAIRKYISSHPETKYLLGFNEPNFSSQANMTPQAAANAWPALETLAEELGLKLVAPALNFSGEKVGGRTWNPYEWYDEFFRLYPKAKVDCLALHCYMNWYSANTWFATEYFYSDLYNTSKTDVYGKYPNLVKFLDDFKAANGHFPRMMLTEFCSWENDGTITGVDFQIDQMTQKVQELEQSDLVEGYAWFIANMGSGARAYPYCSLLQTNLEQSDLSTLGKVYVHMSSFDTDKYYQPEEIIKAKDYTDATTDNQIVRLRPNTDTASSSPLQLEMTSSSWTQYQISVPTNGEYSITMRIKASSSGKVNFYVDGKKNNSASYASTSGAWSEFTFPATLTAGEHKVMLYNASSASFYFSEWSFKNNAGIDGIEVDGSSAVETAVYDLQGRRVADTDNLPQGVYIQVTNQGNKKIIR